VSSASTGLSGIADRYAVALFELAEQDKALDSVAEELRVLAGLIGENADLRRLIRSPVLSRPEQDRAMDAILRAAGASDLVRRFVGVVVAKRRLFVLNDMVRAFLDLLARRRGETSAEVVSAKTLSEGQLSSLSASLKKAVGTDVALSARVDPEILGGLVIKVGSQMVDSSLRTKLSRLSVAIKGIG
jgi:F-type H+-transporting ATPase subunit delta